MRFSWAERAALLVTAAVLTASAVWFLQRGSAAGGYTVTGAHSAAPAPSPSSRVFVPDTPLDLNTAGLEDLMGLPGVGQTRAQAILDYRARYGPFSDPEELTQVPGVGPGTFEGLKDYITVTAEGGSEP